MQSFSSTFRCRRKLFNIPNDSSWPILDKSLGFRPIRPRLTVRGWSYLTTLTKYKQSINCYTSFGVIFSTYQYQLSLLVVRPHIDCPWLVVFDHFDEVLAKYLLLDTIRRFFDKKKLKNVGQVKYISGYRPTKGQSSFFSISLKLTSQVRLLVPKKNYEGWN